MTIRIIQIHSKNRKTIQNHIGNEEDALRILNSDSGSYLKIEDGDFWRVITPEELQAKYKFKHDLNFAGDPWKVYVKRVKSMFVANRAIVIRKDHATDIKAVIPIENAEEYLLNRVGDVLLIQDGLGHKAVTDGEFEESYDIIKINSPWMFVEAKSEEKPKSEKVEEKPTNQTYSKPVRTKHHKTDMLALEITEENYSVAAALLQQNFTTINPKEVIGYFVVINDRMVSIDDRGVSTSTSLNNWACHPDIFHDLFIAVDFAYGDFLHCYREGK
ncbi:hypothetical protein PQB76_gp081 [Arthrobacter phage Cheesy]|uniref:Uncharacterized protein n=1 Tax=Arthrobacter phage Cheesy TaxID=2015816 RepID=A0A222ZKV0_9CAUD|nr:hypothetical protein PQB76_gp081 [Arthrobacter phage Cheesy]ASR84660.1 hypothetical protein SEA_CHEESY_81 [Arthrobacter phage Cheesy]